MSVGEGLIVAYAKIGVLAALIMGCIWLACWWVQRPGKSSDD